MIGWKININYMEIVLNSVFSNKEIRIADADALLLVLLLLLLAIAEFIYSG